MRVIMPQIKPEWVDQILIADGGSTDGTLEYAKEHGYDHFVQLRPGIRHAYIEGFPRITGDIVVTFSPDGNSVPEAIPDLIAKMKEGYDMVVASRYLEHAASQDDDFVTGIGNWVFTKLINLFFRGHYTDAIVIYRAYTKDLFYELNLHKDESYSTEKLLFTTIGIEPLLSMRCAKRKKRTGEIPVDEPERIGGDRKLQIIRWGGAYGLQILKEFVLWNH